MRPIRGVATSAVLLAVAAAGLSAQDREIVGGTIDLTREADVMSSLGIVGYDPATGEVGVAMASRFFAVGYIATHARAGVGAIATMGGAPYRDGPLMLDWLEEGATPAEVLERIAERYENPGQIVLVDARGRSAGVTSGTQSDWKGHRVGEHYAAGGNILAGPGVVDGFGDTFEGTAGRGLPLAERLMRALEAADAAGGDARGRMAAALKVYRPGAGFGGTDLYLDVRVDDSPHSIEELRDLYERWKVERAQEYGSRMIQQTAGADVARLQEWLARLGYADPADAALFDEAGRARGRFNDATVDAVVRFKTDHELGSDPSAHREVVIKLIERIEGRSWWVDPLRRGGGR